MMRMPINVAILQLGIFSGALVGVGGAALAGMNGYAMLSAGLTMAPFSIGAALAIIALRALVRRGRNGFVADVALIALGTIAGGLIVGAVEVAIGFPLSVYALWAATALAVVAAGSILGAMVSQRVRLNAAAPAV